MGFGYCCIEDCGHLVVTLLAVLAGAAADLVSFEQDLHRATKLPNLLYGGFGYTASLLDGGQHFSRVQFDDTMVIPFDRQPGLPQ